MLGTARPLDARHFQSASKDAPAPPDNPGRIDVAELRARVGARLDRGACAVPARSQTAANTARATGTNAADSTRCATRCSRSRTPASTTRFRGRPPVPRRAMSTALTQQADALLARFAVLDPATDDQLGVADSADGRRREGEATRRGGEGLDGERRRCCCRASTSAMRPPSRRPTRRATRCSRTCAQRRRAVARGRMAARCSVRATTRAQLRDGAHDG